MLVGQVLRPQATHRRHERLRIPRQVERKPVGTALVRTRQPVDHRHRHQAPRAHRQQQRRQPGHISDPANAEVPGDRQQGDVPGQQRARGQHRIDAQHPPQVAVHVMRKLVGQDHLDLVIGILREQRV